MEASLEDITNLINEADKTGTAAGGKEMASVERIFNTYYDTMKWIEASTGELKERLQSIEAGYNLFVKYQ